LGLGLGLAITALCHRRCRGAETPDGQVLAVQRQPEELCSTDEPSRRLFADLLLRVATLALAQPWPAGPRGHGSLPC